MDTVPSGSCVRTRRSQAALMAKFAKFKRRSRLNFAKFVMRAAWLRAISHTTPAQHYKSNQVAKGDAIAASYDKTHVVSNEQCADLFPS